MSCEGDASASSSSQTVIPVVQTELLEQQRSLQLAKECLNHHALCAEEAQALAKRHDEMVANLAKEVQELEVSFEQALLKGKVEREAADSPSHGCESPRRSSRTLRADEVRALDVALSSPSGGSSVSRSLLFQHESRDLGLELRKVGRGLDPSGGGDTETVSTSRQMRVRKVPPCIDTSPNKYLLTGDESSLSARGGSEHFFGRVTHQPSKASQSEADARFTTMTEPLVDPMEVHGRKRPTQFLPAAPLDDFAPFVVDSPAVFLHVYELAELSTGIHSLLTTFGTGAFHVGVEVYGREWSFGQAAAPGSPSGIACQMTPKVHPTHVYQESVFLGETKLSPDAVKSLLRELDSTWHAADYNALRRNCVTFSERLCMLLGVDPPPEQVGALMRGLRFFLFA